MSVSAEHADKLYRELYQKDREIKVMRALILRAYHALEGDNDKATAMRALEEALGK
jgi:hypothetical protein